MIVSTPTYEPPDPTPTQPPTPQSADIAPQPSSPAINLLAPENGGQLVVAFSDDWADTIDGKELRSQISFGIGSEAVYAFKDEQPATFDTFNMLIVGTHDANVKEFELLTANDSPTGQFTLISKFQTQNVKLVKSPYQEFKFPAVTAKYLKVKIISTYGWSHPAIHELQLLGSLTKS